MNYLLLTLSVVFILNGCTLLDEDISSDIVKVNKEDVIVNESQFFSTKTPQSCSIGEQNKFVYNVLHDSYLWSDKIPNNDYLINNYSSPKALLDSLKYKNDNFSYIMDLPKADSFFGKGKYNNFGFIPFLIDHENNQLALVVAFVYPGSPSENSGMKRGDLITEVNGIPITHKNIDTIYNMIKKKNYLRFTFFKENRTYGKSLSKYRYTVRTVSHSHIYYVAKDYRVAYMVLSDFIALSKYEIDSVFKKFKQANVKDLILDLRYNGGGDVRIANHLASLIGGDNVSNKIAEHMSYNEKYSNLNKTTFFESYNRNQLSLKRLFVITSERTCSASERVIHNLQASDTGIEVIQIGKKTCGKPYGYEGVGVFCNKVLFSINTESTNSDKVGKYDNGLHPTCEVEDDVFTALGDKEENALKEALYYIEHNSCSSHKFSGYGIVNFIKESLGL